MKHHYNISLLVATLTLFTPTFVCVFVCAPDLNMKNIFSINWLPGICNSKVVR